jgi:hypothetical protein
MIPNKPWIEEFSRDQERIRKEFGRDNRIHYGYNHKDKEFQAWYTPSSSAPYMITQAQSPEHAIRLMHGRQANDQRRAKDVLREIDEYNETVGKSDEETMMHEIRHEMKKVAVGKKFSGPWTNRTTVNAIG